MAIINMHHYFIVFTISTQNMDFLIQIIKQNTTNILNIDFFCQKICFLFFFRNTRSEFRDEHICNFSEIMLSTYVDGYLFNFK